MLFRILHDDVRGELTYLLADAAARAAVPADPDALWNSATGRIFTQPD